MSIPFQFSMTSTEPDLQNKAGLQIINLPKVTGKQWSKQEVNNWLFLVLFNISRKRLSPAMKEAQAVGVGAQERMRWIDLWPSGLICRIWCLGLCHGGQLTPWQICITFFPHGHDSSKAKFHVKLVLQVMAASTTGSLNFENSEHFYMLPTPTQIS